MRRHRSLSEAGGQLRLAAPTRPVMHRSSTAAKPSVSRSTTDGRLSPPQSYTNHPRHQHFPFAPHIERPQRHATADGHTLGSGQDARLHVRDPAYLFQAGAQLSAPYHSNVHPPAGTHDTGHRFKRRQLWLTHPKTKAYSRTTDRAEGRVEARPQAKTGITCK